MLLWKESDLKYLMPKIMIPEKYNSDEELFGRGGIF